MTMHKSKGLTYDQVIVIGLNKSFPASEHSMFWLESLFKNELIDEGIVREFVSKVQQIRKTNDYEMMDNINIYYSHNDEFNKSIKNYIDFIKKETLAIDLIESDGNYENTYDLNGIELGIRLEKRN